MEDSFNENYNVNNQILNNKKVLEKGGCPLPVYSSQIQRNFSDNTVPKKHTYEVNPFNFSN